MVSIFTLVKNILKYDSCRYGRYKREQEKEGKKELPRIQHAATNLHLCFLFTIIPAIPIATAHLTHFFSLNCSCPFVDMKCGIAPFQKLASHSIIYYPANNAVSERSSVRVLNLALLHRFVTYWSTMSHLFVQVSAAEYCLSQITFFHGIQ